MRDKIRKFFLLAISFVFLLSLAGCGSNVEKRYQDYVKSLIAINYLGATQDYIDATGANQEDADKLYQSNIELLAKNIQSYYGVVISDAPEMQQGYIDLARNVYSKVNYSVAKAYRGTNSYYVDITIYPINLFSQTSEEVIAYVEAFNARVSAGDFNEYTLAEYETEFSTGLLAILNEGCLNMTYADPVTVTVEIVEDGDTFYISNRDFLTIDAAMISTNIVAPVATEGDAVE